MIGMISQGPESLQCHQRRAIYKKIRSSFSMLFITEAAVNQFMLCCVISGVLVLTYSSVRIS
ncbi:hypothetical protein BDZ91DRAFT_720740 [Kalaharituber pfeilii]|nr:hypothetical protein BDZ91DRAFT_720740 [Kalaharituber pfeilii]